MEKFKKKMGITGDRAAFLGGEIVSCLFFLALSGNFYYRTFYLILFEVRVNSACVKLFEVKHPDTLISLKISLYYFNY